LAGSMGQCQLLKTSFPFGVHHLDTDKGFVTKVTMHRTHSLAQGMTLLYISRTNLECRLQIYAGSQASLSCAFPVQFPATLSVFV
jgi:hypothetical protein